MEKTDNICKFLEANNMKCKLGLTSKKTTQLQSCAKSPNPTDRKVDNFPNKLKRTIYYVTRCGLFCHHGIIWLKYGIPNVLKTCRIDNILVNPNNELSTFGMTPELFFLVNGSLTYAILNTSIRN